MRRDRWLCRLACALLAGPIFVSGLVAQDTPIGPPGTQVATEETPAAAANSDALRKAAQNPVASLISVPVQNNSSFGIGPFDRNQNVLNIQPVIPIRASENWNIIIRWITPVIWQPAPGTANLEVFGIDENTPAYLAAQNVQKNAGVFGFGDMTPTFFLSPAKPHKVIWGAGPVFVLPTATSKVLGQGKLSIGPSFVALAQPGEWTLGALVNNAWSVAGPSDRTPVNQMTLQYFINYNLKKGWYLSSSPVLTANWKAANGNVWTVPVGGGIGRIMKLVSSPSTLPHSSTAMCHIRLAGRRGHAVANCIPVSQVNQGAAEDVAGAKAETDGTGAAAEEVDASNQLSSIVSEDAQLKSTLCWMSIKQRSR